MIFKSFKVSSLSHYPNNSVYSSWANFNKQCP